MTNCLAQVLKDRGITRSELARSAGLKLKTVNRLINCQVSIGPKVADKIVNRLKIRREDVFFP